MKEIKINETVKQLQCDCGTTLLAILIDESSLFSKIKLHCCNCKKCFSLDYNIFKGIDEND